MNIWLKSAKEIIVVAPKIPSAPMGIETAYLHNKISFRKIPAITILNFSEVIRSLIKLPGIFYKIMKAMKEADHIHLRCPGNICLIACIVQIFFPRKIKTVKYAGNWDLEANQPWTYKLQKWILSNTFLTRNITVLVYGNWPGKSKNILPFFTATFSECEIKKNEKDLGPPYKFLFVGNLVPGKQPIFALHLIEALKEKHINAELHVYGDGPLKYNLENEAENKDYIHLYGNQKLEVLKQAYKDAHFVILASKSEGWPKAVAEGMFFGCIPIATAVSCVPWMLNYGSRGILIPGIEQSVGKRGKLGDYLVDRGQRTVGSQEVLGETVERIIGLLQKPEEMKRMSREAQEWSQEYTLEKFEEEIKKVLKV
ncbi:MAG: glycosyltransferase family 4 protein [Gillisia sp.]